MTAVLDPGSATVAAVVEARVALWLGGDGGAAPATLRRAEVWQIVPLTRCEKLTTGV